MATLAVAMRSSAVDSYAESPYYLKRGYAARDVDNHDTSPCGCWMWPRVGLLYKSSIQYNSVSCDTGRFMFSLSLDIYWYMLQTSHVTENSDYDVWAKTKVVLVYEFMCRTSYLLAGDQELNKSLISVTWVLSRKAHRPSYLRCTWVRGLRVQYCVVGFIG